MRHYRSKRTAHEDSYDAIHGSWAGKQRYWSRAGRIDALSFEFCRVVEHEPWQQPPRRRSQGW